MNPPAARQPATTIEFAFGDRDAVVAAMDDLAARHQGWVTIQPLVDIEDMPQPSGGPLTGWLTGGLPPLPIGTWTAPEIRRGRERPGSVGLAHPANARVARRLVDAGVVMPATWQAVQDNARRGVVLKVPPDAPRHEILAWLLDAMVELTPIDTTGEFRASIHH